MENLLKARLADKIQEFLDDDKNADLIGGTMGCWQDDTIENKNAELMAEAAFTVLKAQSLQQELHERFN